jgi:UDP-N-acetylglucosamine transferase subunit ALG13
MIFVTVGSQLPFDRLIQTMDHWAANNKDYPVFAQIGISDYKPQHIEFCQTMTPEIYSQYLEQADFVVAHAGMGTIISALEIGKQLVLMPRLAHKGEHRNDHQLATAKRFAELSHVIVANNETELLGLVDSLRDSKFEPIAKQETQASPALINAIKQFLNDC